jgi:hypothetical protein
MKHSAKRFAALMALALCMAAPCAAGSITGPQLAQDLQVADLELTDLGFDPSGFFFFTGNTAYDFNGTYEVQIIAAAISPFGAVSLDGATTSQVTFDIDSSGNVASMSGISGISTASTGVPEPSPALLLLGGVALIVCRRVKSSSLNFPVTLL